MTGPAHAAAAAPYGLAWGIPFVGLLLSIAVAPLLAPRLWHHHYGKVAAFWALGFVLPAAALVGPESAVAAVTATFLHEYLPFVLLLGALFTVAGGIRVTGAPRGGPGVNTAMLALGAVVATIVGTTGAAMLMVRPLLRANRHRRRATHVFVFFIFIVANAGGALSPLGDPPLLLGYLRGVPFFWPTLHLAAPAAVMIGGLLGVFYALDRYMLRRTGRGDPEVLPEIEKLGIAGGANLALLAAVIAAVLLRGAWRPAGGVGLLGVHWGLGEMVGDGLLLAVALLSVLFTPAALRRANQFSWNPMIEVAILFAGIFATMIPVAAMIAAGADGPAAALFARLFAGGRPVDPVFYWTAGALSALLDNAPTYLVFFGFAGGDAARLTGELARTLAAISAGAVFFGALTYVGNAPNLLVKAIVESQGVRMPGFLGYAGWALVCVLPWLAVVDLIFFR